MPKYIDVDSVVINAIKGRKFVLQKDDLMGNTAVETVYADLKDFLYSQPDADVLEIVHAEWVDKYDNKYDNHFYVCSKCKGKALYDAVSDELGTDKIVQVLTKVCPHCLAVMSNGGESK